MADVTVYADDLTGALDTGVKFVRGGRRVSVTWHAVQADCDVLVLDTDTREATPAQAVARLVGWSRLASGFVYKKMDSTLRGPFVSESLALATVLGHNRALFAPASPGSGRSVIGGKLLVHGRLLEESVFRKDPRWPTHTGDLLTCIRNAGCKEVALLDLKCVRRGVASVAAQLRHMPQAVAADAETHDDLVILARAVLSEGNWLPVGSAGLAGALAEALSWPSHSGVATMARIGLVVCGSSHPISRAQVRRLVAETATKPLWAGGASTAMLVRQIGESYAGTGLAVIGMSEEWQHPAVAASNLFTMAEAAAQAVRELGIRCLFVTGGETLRLVVDGLGLRTLRPLAELFPGVVISQAELSEGRELLIVSKAGGFGCEDLLVRLLSGAQQQSD